MTTRSAILKSLFTSEKKKGLDVTINFEILKISHSFVNLFIFIFHQQHGTEKTNQNKKKEKKQKKKNNK